MTAASWDPPRPAASPTHPVAVIGMACRFPGAEDLDGFWDLISQGGHAIDEVPASRWSSARYEGASYATRGGFLRELA